MKETTWSNRHIFRGRISRGQKYLYPKIVLLPILKTILTLRLKEVGNLKHCTTVQVVVINCICRLQDNNSYFY